MANRKQRTDSATAAVQIMQASACELFPPEHVPLTQADLPFWLNIIAEKAKADWTAHDLEIAALLARALRKLEAEEKLLDGEDSVITTAGGNLAHNPRLRIISDSLARVMKYRQTLGIHNRGKNGEKRDTDKRTSQAKAIEADLGDDLLARPN